MEGRVKEEKQVFKNIVLALDRIEKRQRLILERLEADEKKSPRSMGEDQWVQKGIDNILAYQAGGKRDEKE